jgi:hypothetical protein
VAGAGAQAAAEEAAGLTNRQPLTGIVAASSLYKAPDPPRLEGWRAGTRHQHSA